MVPFPVLAEAGNHKTVKNGKIAPVKCRLRNATGIWTGTMHPVSLLIVYHDIRCDGFAVNVSPAASQAVIARRARFSLFEIPVSILVRREAESH